MGSMTDTQHFCRFPAPHGHTRYLGVIKVGIRQREAVGRCPIDWFAPELEPLLKAKDTHAMQARVLILSEAGLLPSDIWADVRHYHPPNARAYCEYHGGTKQGISAGEWCVVCHNVRKWALDVLRQRNRTQHLPQARERDLNFEEWSQAILDPYAFDRRDAVNILSLFSDQEVRDTLWSQLDIELEQGHKGDYILTTVKALAKCDPDGVARFSRNELANRASPWHDWAPFMLLIVSKEEGLSAFRDMLLRSQDGSEIDRYLVSLVSDPYLPLIQNEAWAELFAHLILRPANWNTGFAQEAMLWWDDIYDLTKVHFLKGGLSQPLISSPLTRAFCKAFRDRVASGTVPKDRDSQQLIEYILRDCEHV